MKGAEVMLDCFAKSSKIFHFLKCLCLQVVILFSVRGVLLKEPAGRCVSIPVAARVLGTVATSS
jgi:hypothetical protein